MTNTDRENTNYHIKDLKRALLEDEVIVFYGTKLRIMAHTYSPTDGRHTFLLQNGSTINLDEAYESRKLR